MVNDINRAIKRLSILALHLSRNLAKILRAFTLNSSIDNTPLEIFFVVSYHIIYGHL
jgi:hypothetical protein